MIVPATLAQIMRLVAELWTPNHPAGRDVAFARHWLASPWVDLKAFPYGVSALMDEEGRGFTSSIVTPTAGWHVMWAVRPEARGTGLGGQLIRAMREALAPKPMHVFGISSFGLPVYEKLGFHLKLAVRYRFIHQSQAPSNALRFEAVDPAWLTYRYDEHPHFRYQRRGDCIVRTDLNTWGRVLHVARLGYDWPQVLQGEALHYDLVQCWSYTNPGMGWDVPSATVPTVFQPPEARGNTLWTAGWPNLPHEIHGSDGGQDRPA